MEQINAVGRRKAAIARVFVKEGTGVITVNNRTLAEYFPNPILQFIVKQPLALLDVAEKYDLKVNLVGGGYKGQAEEAAKMIKAYIDAYTKHGFTREEAFELFAIASRK